MLPGEASAGIVPSGPMSGRLEGEPERSLQDARFVIGDYVSCAVLPPGADGGPPPLLRGSGGGGRGLPPRENGFGRGRGGGRGSSFGRLNDGGVPMGEWRRGERLPEGSGRGFGRRERGW